ncbi:MAG: hypothetical protein SPI77_02070 [Corynebacterium sp.]|nr:hypothetical protein [Corynebacterium sp.]
MTVNPVAELTKLCFALQYGRFARGGDRLLEIVLAIALAAVCYEPGMSGWVRLVAAGVSTGLVGAVFASRYVPGVRQFPIRATRQQLRLPLLAVSLVSFPGLAALLSGVVPVMGAVIGAVVVMLVETRRPSQISSTPEVLVGPLPTLACDLRRRRIMPLRRLVVPYVVFPVLFALIGLADAEASALAGVAVGVTASFVFGLWDDLPARDDSLVRFLPPLVIGAVIALIAGAWTPWFAATLVACFIGYSFQVVPTHHALLRLPVPGYVPNLIAELAAFTAVAVVFIHLS